MWAIPPPFAFSSDSHPFPLGLSMQCSGTRGFTRHWASSNWSPWCSSTGLEVKGNTTLAGDTSCPPVFVPVLSLVWTWLPKIKTMFLSFSCSQTWPCAYILINGVLSRSGVGNFPEMPYRERACLSLHPLLSCWIGYSWAEPSCFQSWKQHVEEAEEQDQRSLGPDEHGASIYRWPTETFTWHRNKGPPFKLCVFWWNWN